MTTLLHPTNSLMLSLCIGITALVILAELIHRVSSSSEIQSIGWRSCLAALILLLVFELAGIPMLATSVITVQPKDESPPVVARHGEVNVSDAIASSQMPANGEPASEQLASERFRLEQLLNEHLVQTQFGQSYGDETVNFNAEPSPESLLPGSEQHIAAWREEREYRGTEEGSGTVGFSGGPAASDARSSGSATNASIPRLAGASFLVWLSISLVLIVRLAIHHFRLARFYRATTLASNERSKECQRLNSMFGGKPIHVRVGSDLCSPVVFGIFRPTLVIPSTFEHDFDDAQRKVILLHELAHIRRHDPAWQLFENIVVCLLWWHPALWHLRRRLHFVSETRADEATQFVPDGAQILAECLVSLGRRIQRSPRASISIRGQGQMRSTLGKRIAYLLNFSQQKDSVLPSSRWSWAVKTLMALLLVSLFCGSVFANHSAVKLGERGIMKTKKFWQHSVVWLAVVAATNHLQAQEEKASEKSSRVTKKKSIQKNRQEEAEQKQIERLEKEKDQLEAYKRQLVELRQKLTEERQVAEESRKAAEKARQTAELNARRAAEVYRDKASEQRRRTTKTSSAAKSNKPAQKAPSGYLQTVRIIANKAAAAEREKAMAAQAKAKQIYEELQKRNKTTSSLYAETGKTAERSRYPYSSNQIATQTHSNDATKIRHLQEALNALQRAGLKEESDRVRVQLTKLIQAQSAASNSVHTTSINREMKRELDKMKNDIAKLQDQMSEIHQLLKEKLK